MTEPLQRARPVVSRAARFHHDAAGGEVAEEALELRSRLSAPPLDGAPASATASSKRFFARSTPTVVAFMADSF